jgi:hypothetical protein
MQFGQRRYAPPARNRSRSQARKQARFCLCERLPCRREILAQTQCSCGVTARVSSMWQIVIALSSSAGTTRVVHVVYMLVGVTKSWDMTTVTGMSNEELRNAWDVTLDGRIQDTPTCLGVYEARSEVKSAVRRAERPVTDMKIVAGCS